MFWKMSMRIAYFMLPFRVSVMYCTGYWLLSAEFGSEQRFLLGG